MKVKNDCIEDTDYSEQLFLIGVNYEQIPANKCLYMVNNYERNGHMRVDGNSDGTPYYFPASFDNIKPDKNNEWPSWQ